MSEPSLAVLMSVYNQRPFIDEALNSILTQSIREFEFIIVDDGSSDGSTEVIAKAAARDSRIRFVPVEQNIGLAAALNAGLKLCEAEFVARMDGDDISAPDRLEKQLKYIVEHKLDVLGSSYRRMGGYGMVPRRGVKMFPAQHDDIVRALPLSNQICHPAVMMRRSAVLAVGGYDPRFRLAQDYDLWLRMIGTARFGNMPEALLSMRRHLGRSSGPANRARHTHFSVVASVNHFRRTSGQSEFDPACAPEDLALGMLDLLNLGAGTDHDRKALIRHAARFIRHSPCDPVICARLSETVRARSNLTDRIKLQLYRFLRGRPVRRA